MNSFLLIASMALATYSTRIAGFSFRGRALPDNVERFLAGVPIAAFAALVVTGVDLGSAGSDVRILSLILAASVALRWKKLWLTLASGMTSFWIIGYLL